MDEPIDELRVESMERVLAVASWLGDEQLAALLEVSTELWIRDAEPRVSVEEVQRSRRRGHG